MPWITLLFTNTLHVGNNRISAIKFIAYVKELYCNSLLDELNKNKN